MKAKELFDDAMCRAHNLLELYKHGSRNDDILRMAVALGVAALDMYATERFLSACIPYISKSKDNKKTAEFLDKVGFKMEDAVDLLKNPTDRPLRRVRTIIDEVHERDVLQKFDRIDKSFRLFGLEAFSDKVFKKIGKSARGKLERMIQRRHDIVHDADYSSWNRSQNITLRKVEDWMDYMNRYVCAAEEIICSKFASSRRRKRK